jgi:hypothetical protein
VRSGIVAVDAAAEHGDRRPLRLEGAAMRLGVDPAREPADDDEAGGCELTSQPAGDRGAVAGARSGSDDRNRGSREDLRLGFTSQEETRRRIVDRAEERRETRC